LARILTIGRQVKGCIAAIFAQYPMERRTNCHAIDASKKAGGRRISALCFAAVGGLSFSAWDLGIPDMP
jgi:hypothetical protein